jgi:hypothetical protein
MILAMAAPARAQFEPIAKILEKFSYFNVNYVYGTLTPGQTGFSAGPQGSGPRQFGLEGLGVEFGFGIGVVTKTRGTPTDSFKRELVKEVVHTGAAAPDTERTYTVKTVKKVQTDTIIYIDLAVGYSQIAGFSATDTTLQLTGSLRELPNVTIYASLDKLGGPITPYIGLRTGAVSLNQANLYDGPPTAKSRTQFPIAASTYQLGAVAGAIFPFLWGSTAFVETAYMRRTFSSLQYTAKDGVVPPRFPTSFNASGFVFTTGLQFDMPKTLTGGASAATNGTP